MRLRTTSLAMALLAASIGSVSGQQAASAAKTSPSSDLVGLYEGPRGFIAISPLGGGGSTRLLLADAASDQLRMLFPVAADSFVAGPEVAKPEPIQFAVRVRRSPTGGVDALVLHRPDGVPDESARRVALRAVPVAFTTRRTTARHVAPAARLTPGTLPRHRVRARQRGQRPAQLRARALRPRRSRLRGSRLRQARHRRVVRFVARGRSRAAGRRRRRGRDVSRRSLRSGRAPHRHRGLQRGWLGRAARRCPHAARALHRHHQWRRAHEGRRLRPQDAPARRGGGAHRPNARQRGRGRRDDDRREPRTGARGTHRRADSIAA